jgi:hypothetical protein
MKGKKSKETIEERELQETGDTGLDFLKIIKEFFESK